MDHVRVREDGRIAALHVLVKDALDKRQALVVLVLEVQMVGCATGGAVAQVRAHLGEGERVGGGIDLWDDVHAQRARVLDVGLEVLLGVPHVLSGKVRLVLALARFDVRFQAEGGVGLHGVFELLERDEVVVEVDLQVVHLVPGHLVGELAQPLDGERLAAHV